MGVALGGRKAAKQSRSDERSETWRSPTVAQQLERPAVAFGVAFGVAVSCGCGSCCGSGCGSCCYQLLLLQLSLQLSGQLYWVQAVDWAAVAVAVAVAQ